MVTPIMELEGGQPTQPGPNEAILEARQLAKNLTTPGLGRQAAAIQDRLLTLQKSAAGWMIADGFLGSDDPSVRFYGPLTLTMKINQDWNILNLEQRMSLLIRLVDCFILLINNCETPLVMRKFFSTMTCFFFKPDAPWTYCLRHIAVSLANGKYLAEDASDSRSFESLALPSLSHERLLAVLSYTSALAEEASRYATERTESRNRLLENAVDAIALVNYGCQRAIKNIEGNGNKQGTDQAVNTAQESISTLHAWLCSFYTAKYNPPNLASLVAQPLDFAARFLVLPAVASVSMELFTEVLANQPKLVNAAHIRAVLEFLVGPSGEQYMIAILNGDHEEEMMRFLDLLLRYSITKQVEILTGPMDEPHDKVLFLLYKLFHSPGVAQVDDMVTNLVLEFWSEAANDVDELIMEDAIDVTDDLRQKFARVITECEHKLRFPDQSVTSDWDDDEIKLFNAFRRDFTDFLLSVYPLLGVDVIRHVLDQASSSIAKEDWAGFEVALFCLASLAESVAENQHADDVLHTLFHSDLFESVCYGRQIIPSKTRQTLADVVERYTPYFERNSNLLPAVLNFLFASLEFPACDQGASRSISALCRTCRKALPQYVEGFIQKFHELRGKPALNGHTLERVAEGIAAVVQAVERDEEKAIWLLKLLEPLFEEAQKASQEAVTGQPELGLLRGLTVMRCTASIGRGIRAPDDDVIDLDSEGSIPNSSSFWVTNPLGTSIPATIIRILDVLLDRFPNDGEIIEATCDVLKAGYTEKSPGPYVLPTEVTVRFVKATNMSSPRFPTVMASATAFLASHALKPSAIQAEVLELIMHVAVLIHTMVATPDAYDPEAAHSCIDFLTRLLPKYHADLFGLDQTAGETPSPLPTLLSFTLHVLKGPDPLPLRAACSFWAVLLSLPNLPSHIISSAGAMNRDQQAAQPALLDRYLGALGDIVMRQVAGRCARSDLEHFDGIIKKFIFKHQGAARTHFGNALATLNVHLRDPTSPEGLPETQPKSAVSQQEMQKFLASILSLRGARSTNDVVRNFWLLCRGKGFAYA
ncbi:hypothetical protein FQN57_005260 [Myotisia sp. PD_48]|nr:hypothetical protein FQN57_005260 [Myotisia sp. PD_48]